MAGILVYVLHDDEGNFNKNSLGAVSEASKLAGELGSQVNCGDFKAPPQKAAGEIIEDEDTDETVQRIVAWLDERKLLA